MKAYQRWVGVALLPLALAWAGCSTMNVSTDHDPRVNFSQYRTYAWKHPPIRGDGTGNPLTQNSLLDTRVRNAVDAEMAAKGLREVPENQSPDLQVVYYAGVQNVLTSNDVGVGFGGPGAYGYWGPYNSYEYTQGMLIVDFVDPKSGLLVWRGLATDVVSDSGVDPEQVREAVQKMIAEYPPPPNVPMA